MGATELFPLRQIPLHQGPGSRPDRFVQTWVHTRRSGSLCCLLTKAIQTRPPNSNDEEREFWQRIRNAALAPEGCAEAKVKPRHPVPGADGENGWPSDGQEHPLALLLDAACSVALGQVDELSEVGATSYRVPEKRRSFALMARRTLAERAVLASVVVPIAIDNEAAPGKRGWIGRLSLEILQGSPVVAPHLEQFAMGFDSSLLDDSIEMAWRAAEEEILGPGQGQFCGRWRIWNFDCEDFEFRQPGGNSLGGAAARGWAAALALAASASGLAVEVPTADPRLLVIAQVCHDPSEGYFLAPVNDSGVRAKVSEACCLVRAEKERNRRASIDRIAVVSGPAHEETAVLEDGNLRTAQQSIEKEKKLEGWIDVIDIPADALS